jgi:kinetochore protein NNF1
MANKPTMPSASSSHEASPSPPPPAPTASTPGPRAAAFIQLYESALANTLRSISYESFSACFPSISASAPASLQHMHSAFISRLSTFARDEFDTILEERRVVENLNRLEELIADARRRKSAAGERSEEVVPPHMQPAASVRDAHLNPILAAQRSQLNARLQTTQSQNAALAEKLVAQRNEIQQLLGALEGVVKDLEEGGELLGKESEALAAGAREVEEELLNV